ncbi:MULTISPECIES: recombinase family protein [unclassified Streptomyces]|uniref:recombinase family protein n=1 Tax=unclassified Streptomyces TaxID=2593676 RepID=UPI003BB59EBC
MKQSAAASDDFKRVESHDSRTGKGKVASQYHTARFRLVPQLAKTLSVPTPAVRKPGSAWTELPRPVRAGAEPVGHVRLGDARASTTRQSLDAQLDSYAEAGVTRVFSEKISTRATRRPELKAAVKLAGEIRSSGAAVTLVVHEHKRLGRGIELAMLAEELKASSAGGTDDDMLSMPLPLRDQEMSLRDIAKRLVITSGAKRGQPPSPATVLRMLREHDEQAATAASA